VLPFISRRRDLLRLGAGAFASAVQPFHLVRAATPDDIAIANAQGQMTVVMKELMKQQKFFESFGLSPTLIDIADGTRILAGIVSGDVDCSMMSGFGQAFPAIAKGASLKVLAGAALLPTLAIFSAKPDLTSVTELSGRTVGVGSLGALLHQLMVALLLKKGVNPQDVHFVNVGSSADVFRAVVAGVVDAGPGEIAILQELGRYHVHGLVGGNMSQELSEFTFQGAWASDRTIHSKRSALVRSLAAQARLYRFVQTSESHDPFMAAWTALFKGPDTAVGESLWTYIQTYKPFAVDLVLTPQRIDYMQQLNVSVNVQKVVLPFDRVADMSPAEEALKLL
jgi:ABC-type nitrate/sulfonate/bicarbonate transport system substrate-binding protein